MGYDPNADVEPQLQPREVLSELDEQEQLDRENAAPSIPYPMFVTTPAQRDRWEQSVDVAENLAAAHQYDADDVWLKSIANQVYHSDIPTR